LKPLITFSVNLSIFVIIFTIVNLVAGLIIWLERQGGGAFADAVEGVANNRFLKEKLDGQPGPQPMPELRSHPYLIMTAGLSNEHYHTGLEGIRYQDEWSDVLVENYLKNQPVFVFGGSTTYGDGVSNNETFVSFLNTFDPDNIYLNFGVPSYDSKFELKKLVYLLLKGYRPKKVIFVDGLNDFGTMGGGPGYRHAVDINRNREFLRDAMSERKYGSPGYPTKTGFLHHALNSLPLYHLLARLASDDGPQRSDTSIEVTEIDPNYQPWLPSYGPGLAQWSPEIFERQFDKFLSYYRNFMEVAVGLANTFGFKAHFLYQPIGCLDKSNPNSCGNRFNPSYLLPKFHLEFRNQIAAGSIGIKDISECISRAGVSAVAYVDGNHYSEVGNKAMAKCILAETGQ
jgi:hypothetical protein